MKKHAGSNNSLGKVLPIAKDVPILPAVEISNDELLAMLAKRQGLAEKVVGCFIEKATPQQLNKVGATAKTRVKTIKEKLDIKTTELWNEVKETMTKEEFIKAIVDIFLLMESESGNKTMNFSKGQIRRYLSEQDDVDINFSFTAKRVKRSKTATAQGAGAPMTEAEAEAKSAEAEVAKAEATSK